jgi:serine/threonine-protein kinase
VKLLDFGLAKHLGSVSDDGQVTDPLTQTGAVIGTLHYMAPEQFVPGALVDHRSDLFSLGAVLYQMATGTRPFEAKSKDDVIALIQEQPHIPLRHRGDEASGGAGPADIRQ